MVPGVLDADTLGAVENEITGEIDKRANELVQAGELSQTFADLSFETRLAAISRETDKVARAIWNGALAGPAFFGLICHPALLDVAAQLCQTEELIASSVYRLRPKIPNYDYGAVPWHQDSGYFEPYCDNALVLTVWLPLVDATPERGCLWVMPQAHKGDVLTHRGREGKAYLQIPDELLPTDKEPVCVPVPKGGVLLMSNKTPHTSFDNTSDIVRWSMDLRYQSATLPTNALISRLPGETISDIEKGVPVACYPPEADFLVRSRARPDEVLTDPQSFRALRENHVRQTMTSRWK